MLEAREGGAKFFKSCCDGKGLTNAAYSAATSRVISSSVHWLIDISFSACPDLALPLPTGVKRHIKGRH